MSFGAGSENTGSGVSHQASPGLTGASGVGVYVGSIDAAILPMVDVIGDAAVVGVDDLVGVGVTVGTVLAGAATEG